MIIHCPICKYSLEGLPERHRCPECGFDYDKDSVLFPAPRAAWAWLGTLNGIAILCLAAIWWMKSAPAHLIGWLLVFLIPCSGHFWRYRKASETAVLVSDTRVREIRNHVVIKTVHFDGLDRANWSFVSGGLCLYRSDGTLEIIRTVANRAIAREIQTRLAKQKTPSDGKLGSSR